MMKHMNPQLAAGTKVLAFDVFGTVVDWYKNVMQELGAMNLDVDRNKFTLAWRAGYMPAIRFHQ